MEAKQRQHVPKYFISNAESLMFGTFLCRVQQEMQIYLTTRHKAKVVADSMMILHIKNPVIFFFCCQFLAKG